MDGLRLGQLHARNPEHVVGLDGVQQLRSLDACSARLSGLGVAVDQLLSPLAHCGPNPLAKTRIVDVGGARVHQREQLPLVEVAPNQQ